MSWNIDAAINHLKTNAAPSPIRKCGLYVRLAINAGGLNVSPAGYAGYYGPNLTNQGFQLIENVPENSGDYPCSTNFQKGDVVIYDIMLPNVKYGHAQMYTGSKWISDYHQRWFWCYEYSRPALRIYRYPRPHHTPTPSEPVPPPAPTPTPGPPTSRPPAPAQHPYPGRTKRVGSRGDAVQMIQAELSSNGWPLEADGIYGRMTKSAVVSFQQTHGLVPDGIVGPKTWSVLFG